MGASRAPVQERPSAQSTLSGVAWTSAAGLLVICVYLFLRWVQKRPQDADVFLGRFLSYHLQGFKRISAGYSNNEQFVKIKKK